jgi:hypothetical protein
MTTRAWFSKLATTVVAFLIVLKEAFLVFWGIDKEDKGSERAEKIAKTTSKGVAYWLSDYALTALSPATVGFLKWLGWSDFPITMAMWLEDLAIAYGIVLFSRHVIEDFTTTEALRSSIEVVWHKSRIAAILVSVVVLVRFSLWDGPERVVIFFKKELGKRYQEILVLIIFSLFQAIFWTKIYSLGIDGMVSVWKVFF